MTIIEEKEEGNGNFPPTVRCFRCASPGPRHGAEDRVRLYPFLGAFCCSTCAEDILQFLRRAVM